MEIQYHTHFSKHLEEVIRLENGRACCFSLLWAAVRDYNFFLTFMEGFCFGRFCRYEYAPSNLF
jgi:hypothetical protein